MKTTVAVFFGGRSTEHEISVISANQAMHAINRERFDVVPVYISKQGHWYTGDALFDVKNYRDTKALLANCEEVYMRPIYGDTNLYKVRKPMFGSDVLRRIDVVIPVLHGANGEDGTFEGFLEQCGVPFAGCNTLASANGMDKITMKQILAANGIPVVAYEWFTDQQWHSDRDAIIERVEKNLGYPVIVKPANLGSSVGISAAHSRQELVDALNEAQRYSTRLIVEHMIKNLKEINCSVLGDADEYQTSVLEEPIKSGDFLSYEEKYLGGGGGSKGGVKGAGAKGSRRGMASSQKKFPADLPDEMTKQIQHLASETFRVLSCHGVSRVDVMVDDNSKQIYVNEINTIPGSLSFYLWEGSGISFDKLMERLVALALKRRRRLETKTLSFDQNIFAMSKGNGVKGAKQC